MTFSSSFGRVFSPTFHSKSQAKAGGIVVYDTFTDDNDVLLSAHTPEIRPAGSSWGGGINTTTKILNNAATDITIYGTSSGCGIDTGLVNCKITGNVSGNKASAVPNYYRAAGIKVRCNTAAQGVYNDSATWYGIVISPVNDKFWILEKSSGNSYTVRAEASVVLAEYTSYLIVVTLSGTTITATLNGANEISYANATTNQNSTIHGIKPTTFSDGGGAPIYNYDFLVESI